MTRCVILAALLVATTPALAQSDPEPEASPVPEASPAPSPAAAPSPSPAASPAPAPVPPEAAAPAATPAPTLVIGSPVSSPRPTKWELEAGLAWQGVFDGGIHVFSADSWLNGAELRLRRGVSDADMGLLSVAPELSYFVAHTGRGFPSSASTELWFQRFSAGVRTAVRVDRYPAVRPFARAGVSGLWSTALAHDPYRHHREEAYGYGAYASAGFELDLGLAIVRPEHRVRIAVEGGHLYTPGLSFGRMGVLDVNAAFAGAQVSTRF